MQPRLHSLIETVTSTATGLAVSMALTAWIMPLYGFNPTLGQNAQITLVFTLASVLRGYAMRRLFNRWHPRMDPWHQGYQWAAAALLAQMTTPYTLAADASSDSDRDRGVRAAVQDFSDLLG